MVADSVALLEHGTESMALRAQSMTRPSASMVGPYHAHHRALPAAMSDRALSEDPNSHLAHKLPYRAHKHSDRAGPFDEHWRDLSNMQCNGRY